ncbi:MAG: hypothetical protein HY801_13720 [Candidatus Lindowbacteria bacterium]|nr:hypothetical protein [Candidatus Lindowbacteria bacterium]
MKPYCRNTSAHAATRLFAARPASMLRPLWRPVLLACAMLLLPASASAWGERAHRKIAELALEELPSPYRAKIVRYKGDVLGAAAEDNSISPAQNGAPSADPTADIQLLMLLPHDGNEL